MPSLTEKETKRLADFSNKVYDFLYAELDLSEKSADEIARRVISLIQRMAENKES